MIAEIVIGLGGGSRRQSYRSRRYCEVPEDPHVIGRLSGLLRCDERKTRFVCMNVATEMGARGVRVRSIRRERGGRRGQSGGSAGGAGQSGGRLWLEGKEDDVGHCTRRSCLEVLASATACVTIITYLCCVLCVGWSCGGCGVDDQSESRLNIYIALSQSVAVTGGRAKA